MSGFFNANRLVKRVDRLELLNSTLEIPSPSWGIIEGNLQDQEDLQTALDSKGGLRTFNQWSGTNVYTGQVQFHNTVYFNDRTGIMFDPESTSISKQAYAQIAYRASTDRHFKFKVHGIPNSTFWGNLDFSGILSSDKTFTFPNKSGTIALLDDVSDSVTTGFGLSTNGAGELQLGNSIQPNFDAVSLSEGQAIIIGDELASGNPFIAVNNGFSSLKQVSIGVGEVNNSYIDIDSAFVKISSMTSTDNSNIIINPSSIDLSSNEVNVPTPVDPSNAATKAYVDSRTGGFSGSFATATDTITVVNGLITDVTPL